jgi:hypothetical protein
MKRTITWSLCVAALALVLARAREARAGAKQACSAAYDATQTLRDEGKLIDARKQALACSAPTCSAYVVKDCARWLAEIEASTPTVVFTAEDASGADTVAVRVSVDGRLVCDKLDGKAVPMDPGDHVVRFELSGADPIEQKLLIRQGQKDRSVATSFKKKDAAGTLSAHARAAPPLTTGAVVLGIGGVGILIGVGFGVAAIVKHGALAKACSSGVCPLSEQSELATYRAWGVTSTVSFIEGAVVGMIGLGMLLAAPGQAPAATARVTPHLRVTPYLGLGTAGVWGRF